VGRREKFQKQKRKKNWVGGKEKIKFQKIKTGWGARRK
jgi:hypothetical protein